GEDGGGAGRRGAGGFIGDTGVASVSGLVGRLRAAGADAGKVLDQVRDALRGQLPFRVKSGGANPPGGAIEGLVGLLETEAQDIRDAATAFQQRIDRRARESLTRRPPAERRELHVSEISGPIPAGVDFGRPRSTYR